MKKILLMLALLLSVNLYAKNSGHVLTGRSASEVMMVKSSSAKSYDASFSTAVGYGYAFTNGFEFDSNFTLYIGSGSTKTIALTIGPTMNFSPDDLENSFFMAIQGGVSNFSFGSYSNTKALGYLEVAKRFKLIDGVSYNPGVEMTKYFDDASSDPVLSINLFKISVIF